MTLNALVIVIIGFVIMEAANVISLYFLPGSKFANGIGVFKAWEKSKQDPEVHDLVKYLVYWVAGTKVISILLLVVILLTAQGKNFDLCRRRDGAFDCDVLLAAFPAHPKDGSKWSDRTKELLRHFGLDDTGFYPGIPCGGFGHCVVFKIVTFFVHKELQDSRRNRAS